VNPDQRHDHLQRLTAARIDPAAAEQSGLLEVRIDTEAYIRDGHFDHDRMLAASRRWPAATPREDSRSVVFAAAWTGRLEIDHTLTTSLSSEARVNTVWRRHDDEVIYGVGQFGGDTVIDIMRTHPMIIIGGILRQNPFFVPHEQFLLELHRLRAMRTFSSSTAA
jgi:MEDS: MEthanogen/methylotroph, DcmR Sensory domain